MTERELSIIRALGEEFAMVLADLQRTFEEKIAAQAKRLKKNWLLSLWYYRRYCENDGTGTVHYSCTGRRIRHGAGGFTAYI